MSIWVTSDLHLNHTNIIKYCRPDFDSIEQHNQYIIDQYNSVVGKDDLVYILGDVCFRPRDKAVEILKKLNGRKILICGNHDTMTDNEYKTAGFIDVIHHPVYYSDHIILSHIPVLEALNNPYVINVHGHVHHGYLRLPNFFNVNVEENSFLPINIKVFEEMSNKICTQSRWQSYETEWYASFEENKLKKVDI